MATRTASQNERVRARLLKFGRISRNECLNLAFPRITRLAARIKDLEKKYGFEFREKDDGRDFVYHLTAINGVSYHKPAEREQIMRENAGRIAWFDNYQPDPQAA